VDDYAGVIDLLRRARAGFGSQLTAFEVMWPEFYRLATVELKHTPPLSGSHGVYVLIETQGLNPASDPQHFESVIGEAIEAGVVKDAAIAQSEREVAALWKIRDTPGEWPRTVHNPQMGFDVSVPTGEIGDLAQEIAATLKERWPELVAVYFGHVADGNLHVSVRMSGHGLPPHPIEEAVYGLVARRRGSISAEHGIGILKREFLHLSRSPAELALMRAVKHAMDPHGILNPGKIL
jgi:FAD/FMN-containing dehydrogenase